MEPATRTQSLGVLLIYRTRSFLFRVARIERASAGDLERWSLQHLGVDLTADGDIDRARAIAARWCDTWLNKHGETK